MHWTVMTRRDEARFIASSKRQRTFISGATRPADKNFQTAVRIPLMHATSQINARKKTLLTSKGQAGRQVHKCVCSYVHFPGV